MIFEALIDGVCRLLDISTSLKHEIVRSEDVIYFMTYNYTQPSEIISIALCDKNDRSNLGRRSPRRDIKIVIQEFQSSIIITVNGRNVPDTLNKPYIVPANYIDPSTNPLYLVHQIVDIIISKCIEYLGHDVRIAHNGNFEL